MDEAAAAAAKAKAEAEAAPGLRGAPCDPPFSGKWEESDWELGSGAFFLKNSCN